MRFWFFFFLIKEINVQESNPAPPNPIFTSILHCKLLRSTTKSSTFLRNFWMNSAASSRNSIWRWQLCDQRGCGDTAVRPCLIPTAPTLHLLVPDMGYSWIVLAGSQFRCFHLKEVHFCCCCENLFFVLLSSPGVEGSVWSSCRWEHRTRAAEFTFLKIFPQLLCLLATAKITPSRINLQTRAKKQNCVKT